MKVVIIETGEVITDQELQQLFPNTSFPPPIYWTDELLVDDFGVELLRYDPQPALDLLETLRDGEVRKEDDGHYYQAWVIVFPDPDELEKYIKSIFRETVNGHMDEIANQNGFFGILDASSYADEASVPRLQAKGAALRKWRSLVWDYADAQITLIATKQRPRPEADAFLSELPTPVMPPVATASRK